MIDEGHSNFSENHTNITDHFLYIFAKNAKTLQIGR